MLLRVPATSANLGPGFDSLGLALELYNYFSLKPSKFASIQIHGEGSKNPKLRIDNVFVKIFNEQLKKLIGQTIPFKFTFENSIPISRGLGSSSAVIIGAIAVGMSAVFMYKFISLIFTSKVANCIAVAKSFTPSAISFSMSVFSCAFFPLHRNLPRF